MKRTAFCLVGFLSLISSSFAQVKTVTVNTNGILAFPTNFFNLNSTSLYQVMDYTNTVKFTNLGTMAYQFSNNVFIAGGTLSNVTVKESIISNVLFKDSVVTNVLLKDSVITNALFRNSIITNSTVKSSVITNSQIWGLNGFFSNLQVGGIDAFPHELTIQAVSPNKATLKLLNDQGVGVVLKSGATAEIVSDVLLIIKALNGGYFSGNWFNEFNRKLWDSSGLAIIGGTNVISSFTPLGVRLDVPFVGDGSGLTNLDFSKLGSMAFQNSNQIKVMGGSLSNVVIANAMNHNSALNAPVANQLTVNDSFTPLASKNVRLLTQPHPEVQINSEGDGPGFIRFAMEGIETLKLMAYIADYYAELSTSMELRLKGNDIFMDPGFGTLYLGNKVSMTGGQISTPQLDLLGRKLLGPWRAGGELSSDFNYIELEAEDSDDAAKRIRFYDGGQLGAELNYFSGFNNLYLQSFRPDVSISILSGSGEVFISSNVTATGSVTAKSFNGSVPASNLTNLSSIVSKSVTVNANKIELVGDATSPGTNKVYGTSTNGVKGWRTVSPFQIVTAGVYVWNAGASSTATFNISGVLDSDVLQATLRDQNGSERLIRAVPLNNAIYFELDTIGVNGDTTISYSVIRAF